MSGQTAEAPGIYPGMKMDEYVALKAFSGSLAQTVLTDCPYQAWFESSWNPDRPPDNAKAADVGTTMHDLLLGGEGKIEIIDPNDYPSKTGSIPAGWTNNAIRGARNLAYSLGKTPMLIGDYAAAKKARDAALAYLAQCADPAVRDVFSTGAGERTIIFMDRGMLCKCRPDWLSADRLVHLSYKSTIGSANPSEWIRRILPQHDVSAVLYERGIRAACGVERTHTVWLAQAQKPPYLCSLIDLGPAWQEMAERRLNIALDIWRECLWTGLFPAYPTHICSAEPSSWQMAAVEEQEASAGMPYEPDKIPDGRGVKSGGKAARSLAESIEQMRAIERANTGE